MAGPAGAASAGAARGPALTSEPEARPPSERFELALFGFFVAGLPTLSIYVLGLKGGAAAAAIAVQVIGGAGLIGGARRRRLEWAGPGPAPDAGPWVTLAVGGGAAAMFAPLLLAAALKPSGAWFEWCFSTVLLILLSPNATATLGRKEWAWGGRVIGAMLVTFMLPVVVWAVLAKRHLAALWASASAPDPVHGLPLWLPQHMDSLERCGLWMLAAMLLGDLLAIALRSYERKRPTSLAICREEGDRIRAEVEDDAQRRLGDERPTRYEFRPIVPINSFTSWVDMLLIFAVLLCGIGFHSMKWWYGEHAMRQARVLMLVLTLAYVGCGRVLGSRWPWALGLTATPLAVRSFMPEAVPAWLVPAVASLAFGIALATSRREGRGAIILHAKSQSIAYRLPFGRAPEPAPVDVIEREARAAGGLERVDLEAGRITPTSVDVFKHVLRFGFAAIAIAALCGPLLRSGMFNGWNLATPDAMNWYAPDARRIEIACQVQLKYLPGDPVATAYLADVHASRGDLKTSSELTRSVDAMGLTTGFASVLNKRVEAWVQLRLKTMDDARAEFKKAPAPGVPDADAYAELKVARFLLKFGVGYSYPIVLSAVYHAREAVRRMPDNPDAKKVLAEAEEGERTLRLKK